MKSYSHSSIGTFEQCPQKFKFAYLDGIKREGEDTIEPFMGSLVHEALEKLYKDLQYEKILTEEELVAYFLKTWKENWHKDIVINRKEYTAENYRNIGERCLRDYYKRHHPFKEGRVIGLETKERLPLDGTYTYHIRIDRLVDRGNGLYEVHDYKAGASLPSQKDLDEDRQLAMYSLWALHEFKDAKKVVLIWHYLAFDKELKSERTVKQLKKLKEEVLKVIRTIETTKVFPTKVTRLCNWCEYQDICPAWKHSVTLEEKTPNEYLKDDGVKLVNKYAKIKNELKEIEEKAESELEKLKEALISFARKNDVEVIFGSDNKISVKEYSSFNFPSKHSEERNKLIATLKKLNLFGKVTDIDTTALKHLFDELQEKDPKKGEKIASFVTETKEYRVSLSKKRTEEN